VIAEDVKSVRSYASCGNVNNARKELACDLIHVGDHEKKTLRSSISSGECACAERAVYGTCCACLGLHLYNLNVLAEDVLRGLAKDVLVRCGPSVGYFRHRAGRGDRIDGCNLGERVRHVSRGCVTIHRNFLSFYHGNLYLRFKL
jgi:hypothetical protein